MKEMNNSDKSVTDKVYKSNMGRTICEVHREIYDVLHDKYKGTDDFDAIVSKLEEAYGMAKKMDAKLRQYKNNYDDNWWEKERIEVIKEKLNTRNNRK